MWINLKGKSGNRLRKIRRNGNVAILKWRLSRLDADRLSTVQTLSRPPSVLMPPFAKHTLLCLIMLITSALLIQLPCFAEWTLGRQFLHDFCSFWIEFPKSEGILLTIFQLISVHQVFRGYRNTAIIYEGWVGWPGSPAGSGIPGRRLLQKF